MCWCAPTTRSRRGPRCRWPRSASETLLLADQERAPEFNEFVSEVCRTAGFFPALFHGSVQNLRAAVDLVLEGRCVLCVPASAAPWSADVTWRPLEPPVPRYPWSILWRAQDPVELCDVPGRHGPPPLRRERLAQHPGGPRSDR